MRLRKKPTWKDIDLENNILIVRNRKGSGKRKNGARDMSVPLIGESYDVVKRLKERPNIPTEDNDPVFVNDSGVKSLKLQSWFQELSYQMWYY